MSTEIWSDLTGSERTAVLREQIGALPPVPRRLLAAMAVCAPQGWRLDLAAAIAGLSDDMAQAALHKLRASSLVSEGCRLESQVGEAAADHSLSRRHAEIIRQRLESWDTNWLAAERDLNDLRVALIWALANGSDLAKSLAYNGFLLAWTVGRLDDAFDICRRMSQKARRAHDQVHLQTWLTNEALVLRALGRPAEALATYIEEEALCRALGNEAGLRASWESQAEILSEQSAS